jgi:hypothetical protein
MERMGINSFYVTGRRTTRQRVNVLRSEHEVAAALDAIDSDIEEDLLSRAGSIQDLSRWIGEELQLGKEKEDVNNM